MGFAIVQPQQAQGLLPVYAITALAVAINAHQLSLKVVGIKTPKTKEGLAKIS